MPSPADQDVVVASRANLASHTIAATGNKTQDSTTAIIQIHSSDSKESKHNRGSKKRSPLPGTWLLVTGQTTRKSALHNNVPKRDVISLFHLWRWRASADCTQLKLQQHCQPTFASPRAYWHFFRVSGLSTLQLTSQSRLNVRALRI